MHKNKKYPKKTYKNEPNFIPKNRDVVPWLFRTFDIKWAHNPFDIKGALDPFKNPFLCIDKDRDVISHIIYGDEVYISPKITTGNQNPGVRFGEAVDSAIRGKQWPHLGVFNVNRLFGTPDGCIIIRLR